MALLCPAAPSSVLIQHKPAEPFRITVFSQDDALMVPTGAMFRRGETWHAFVVKDGRAEDRELRLARRSGRLTAVAAGVKEGEPVIVYPGDRVSSGIRVKPR